MLPLTYVEKFHGAIKTGSADTVKSVLQNSSSPELVINARNKVSVLLLTYVEKFHGAIKTGSAQTMRSVLQNSSSLELVINARNKVRALPYLP